MWFPAVEADMGTSEAECLEALREAVQRLGKSPTKAAYEELGLTPASATIIRVVGGWNEAKRKAGLSTNPSTGRRVGPQPDDVTLPDGTDWEALSVDQRWHYRNVEWNTERTLDRRARLRSWVNEYKRTRGCQCCGEDDPACLDCHHRNQSEKEMAVGRMITYGYGKQKLRDELQKCDVLCANCHRKEHATAAPATEEGGDVDQTGRQDGTDDSRLREWVTEYKRARGCTKCDEIDPHCLVFHHEGAKRATITRMVADGYPGEEVRTEIEKCVLLCANCHRQEHFEPPAGDDDPDDRLRQS